MWRDVRLAARLLVRDRSFTLTAIGALTLGIAANSMVFTLVNGVLLRDLPFVEPHRLIALKSRDTAKNLTWNLSYPDFRDLQSSSPRALVGIAAIDQSPMNVVDDSRNATRLTGAYVSAGTLELLGRPPQVGRDFSSEDDQVGVEPVVVLGHALWQRSYAGSPDVIGRAIRVDGVNATVIGVIPEGFGFPDAAELWRPLAALPPSVRERRYVRSLDALGRLAPGMSADQARVELGATMAGLARQYSETNAGIGSQVFPYREEIDTAGLLTMRIELPSQRYATAEQHTAFYRQLDERLAALPGMQAAIAAPAPRMSGPERWLAIEGRQAPEIRQRPRVTTVAVGRQYFGALGITPRSGRGFAALDGTAGRAAVIVNERFVSQYLPDRQALGQRIELGPDGPYIGATGWLTIVGVIPNVRQNEEEESAFDAVAYLPFAAFPLPNAMLIARSELGVAAVAGAIRDTVRSLDPDMPLFEIATLDDALAAERWPLRIFGTMFWAFAISALTLAALGLYAVTAYATARRTREIGVRVALGARPCHIWWTVSRRVAIQLGVGLAIGLAGAVAGGQMLQSIMGGVNGSDPATLMAVPAVLVAVAFVAVLIPTRRAIRINPVEALRTE